MTDSSTNCAPPQPLTEAIGFSTGISARVPRPARNSRASQLEERDVGIKGGFGYDNELSVGALTVPAEHCADYLDILAVRAPLGYGAGPESKCKRYRHNPKSYPSHLFRFSF
jgi:hypothetical protein